MIMFDIAEWVANVLVLGLGMFFWSLFFAVMFLIISELVSINESIPGIVASVSFSSAPSDVTI